MFRYPGFIYNFLFVVVDRPVRNRYKNVLEPESSISMIYRPSQPKSIRHTVGTVL